jgi:aspartyl-tRNA(Asn)/glutamyl-tRNA(Gln) amidotransferase subunit A
MKRLEDAGAKVETFEMPQVAEAMALAGKLFAPEAYATWRDRIEADPDAMYPPVCARFRSGREISAPDYIAAWQELDRLRVAYARATAHFDAVCLPTVPILPPNRMMVEADPALFAERNLLALQNTRIGNLMGLAGVTLPTGTPSVGLLFQGPVEEKLLRLAAAAERALA